MTERKQNINTEVLLPLVVGLEPIRLTPNTESPITPGGGSRLLQNCKVLLELQRLSDSAENFFPPRLFRIL